MAELAQLTAYSLEQPALVVADLDAATDRMHALFGALPSERIPKYNAVYPFGANTYLELLGPFEPGHTRARFLARNGPGFYMICATLENQDVEEVEAQIKRSGKRIVRSMVHHNVRKTWHIHPHDAPGMLVLLAVKTDVLDNTDWCGHSYKAYIDGNTRYVDQVGGLIARTADPAAEALGFAELGFPMSPLPDGAQRWQGRAGTVVELWPSTSWLGRTITDRRDYALCLRTQNAPAVLSRLAACGLTGEHGMAGGRWLSSTDPVLGVRFAVEEIAPT